MNASQDAVRQRRCVVAVGESKITEKLARALVGETDSIRVIVELVPAIGVPGSGDRASHVRLHSERFEQDFSEVEEMVESRGGRVLGKVWINRTARVEVRPDVIAEIAAHPQVALIDLPARITRG